jgi:ABC-2 type transport system ATP-binding protein
MSVSHRESARESAIVVRHLWKRYGAHAAVRGIDFEVAHGEVFGILGPNGAGKTTTVEILEGFRARSDGDVRVLGIDPAGQPLELRRRLGVVPQDGGLPSELSVTEVIDMFRRYYEGPLATDDLLSLVELGDKRKQRVKNLSGGQRRRVDIAVALAGDPDLVFLDEPTTGFDPAARRRAWQVIRNLASAGKTVVLTTHYMEEAQAVCDRVALLVGGQIVAEGDPASLGTSVAPSRITFLRPPARISLDDLAPLGELHCEDAIVTIEVTNPVDALGSLLRWSRRRDVTLRALSVTPPTLEDTYLRLTEDSQEVMA